MAVLLVLPSILRGGPSSITLTSSANPSVFGSPLTLTATVSASGSGRVTFYDGTSMLGIRTLAGGKAVLTTSLLPTGARSLKAYYSGDAANAPSTSATLAQTVYSQPANGFRQPVSYTVAGASNLSSIAVDDFNGDGKPDLAIAGGTFSSTGAPQDTIRILLGKGDGTFQPVATYPAASPVFVAVGDFNGDGKTDLVVASNTNIVSILLGNGDGTFQAPVGYIVGIACSFAVVADFNGDGKADLAVADLNGPASLLLGNGDGTFQPPAILGASGIALAVGDFNADGKADLVVGNSVLLGNGDGTFLPALSYGVPASPLSIAVGDFNADGKVDLAVTSSGNNVSVLLGNGDGSFPPAVNYGTSLGPLWVALGDVNGDGNSDLVVANGQGNNVNVLLGNGDGSFQPAVSYNSGGSPSCVALGDFNGDGKTDLALLTRFSTVNIFLGFSFLPSSAGLVTSPNPSTFGQTVTMMATVSPSTATGSVNFYDGTTFLGSLPLAAGSASLPTSSLNRGVHSLSTSYSGDGIYSPSTSPAVPQSVGPAPTAIILSSSSNPAGIGGNVILTANVSPAKATGSVMFYNGTAAMATIALTNGQAELPASFPVSGTYSLTASYSGDGNYLPSTSEVLVQAVGLPGPPTTTTLTSSNNPSVYGTPITLTATVSPAGAPIASGRITFYDGVTVLGTSTASDGQAALTTSLLPSGARSLKAYYLGDSNHAPSTSTVCRRPSARRRLPQMGSVPQ